jgi:hypothetical protein
MLAVEAFTLAFSESLNFQPWHGNRAEKSHNLLLLHFHSGDCEGDLLGELTVSYTLILNC